MRSPDKRVNIISHEIRNERGEVVQASGILMRTTRSYAEKCVAAGTHAYTSKSKLKSFLNKNAKLYRNEKILAATKIDLNKLGSGNELHKHSKLFRDATNGKTYIALFKKMLDVFKPDPDGRIAMDGKPMGQWVNIPMRQLLIVRFPE